MTDVGELGLALSGQVQGLKELAQALNFTVTSPIDHATRQTLFASIEGFERQIASYSARALLQRNALSAVNRLSPELLTDVFRELRALWTDDSPLSERLSITHVCTLWRAVALRDALLWTTINAPMHSLSEVLESFLTRSKNLPCAALVHFFNESKDSTRRQKHYRFLDYQGALNVTATLSAHTDRFSHLTLLFHRKTADAVSNLLSVPFRSLTHLHLEYLPEQDDYPHMRSRDFYTLANNAFTASLTELLTLTLVNVQPDKIYAYPMTKLTTLDLRGNARITYNAVAALCSKNPGLVNLTLGIGLGHVTPPKMFRWHSPSISQLHMEDLSDETVGAIYRRLEFAALPEVSLNLGHGRRLSPGHLSRVFDHVYRVTYAEIHSCSKSCHVYVQSDVLGHTVTRTIEAEESLPAPELLEQLAYDFRFLDSVTVLSVNPCLWQALADAVDGLPLHFLRSLDIDIQACHDRTMPESSKPSRKFDTQHVRLGSKHIECPALEEITIGAAGEDSIEVDSAEFILSIIDMVDIGEEKLQWLNVYNLSCPALRASGALSARAVEVQWSDALLSQVEIG